jgi:hypothetical protein
MNWAKIIIVILAGLGLLINLYWDVEGRPAKAPAGFGGVLSTLIVYVGLAFLYYYAGIFN